VFLNSLKYMGMMTQNQIRPIVDGGMSQALLVVVRIVFFLHSPVETDNYNLCSLGLHLLNILNHPGLTAHAVGQFVSSDQTHFHAVYINYSGAVIPESSYTCLLHIIDRVRIALIPIVMAVI